MTTQAFDVQNLQDYDENTRILDEALLQIEKNSNLAATISQVSKMTGIHRNTIRGREFPKTRLDEIKAIRKLDRLNKNKETKNQINQLIEERDNIAKEVAVWFSEYRLAKRDRDDFERQALRQKESADFYRKTYKDEKEKVKILEAKNEQLTDLLRD